MHLQVNRKSPAVDQQARRVGFLYHLAQNQEVMIYTYNTKVETLNQHAKLLKQKHFNTCEKAEKTDTKIQIALTFLQTPFLS